MLVEAFAGLAAADPTARLRLVGHGPQAEALARQAARLGIAHRVELVGSLAPACVPAALQGFDVAVAPYDDPEQDYFSPLKVFEYLAAGLPVVASDVGQLRGLLDVDGEPAGLLVPPGDPAALREALCVLAHDRPCGTGSATGPAAWLSSGTAGPPWSTASSPWSSPPSPSGVPAVPRGVPAVPGGVPAVRSALPGQPAGVA